MLKKEELFDVQYNTLETLLNVSDNKTEIEQNIYSNNRFDNMKQLMLEVGGKTFKITNDRVMNLEDTLTKLGYVVCSIEQNSHFSPNGKYNVKLKDNTSMTAVWIEKRAKILYKQEQEIKRYEIQKNLVHY